jgi:hypothetical protein
MINEQHIATTAAPLPFTPPTLFEKHRAACMLATPEERDAIADPPVFLVQPATEADFDRLGYELFRHNIVPISQDTFRAATIEEIFVVHGDEKGDELATLLDTYWQSEDVYRDQMADWHEQDRQRLLDIAQGAPRRDPAPLPQRLMGLRDRGRATIIADDMRRASRKLRDLTVEMTAYEPRQVAGLTRMLLTGWSGVSTPYAFEDGIVPEATWDALRNEIGAAAIKEIEGFAMSHSKVQDTERGNLESRPETPPDQMLSPEPNGEQADSAGDLRSEAPATEEADSS